MAKLHKQIRNYECTAPNVPCPVAPCAPVVRPDNKLTDQQNQQLNKQAAKC